MADFIFRVSSANLTEAQKQQIATAIQATVLHEIANLDLGGQPGLSFLFRPVTYAGGDIAGIDQWGVVSTTTLTVTERTAT
jgi:hypothetical protein